MYIYLFIVFIFSDCPLLSAKIIKIKYSNHPKQKTIQTEITMYLPRIQKAELNSALPLQGKKEKKVYIILPRHRASIILIY